MEIMSEVLQVARLEEYERDDVKAHDHVHLQYTYFYYDVSVPN